MTINTGRSTDAQVSYMIALVYGPLKFAIRGQGFEIGRDSEALVMMRIISAGRMILDRKIVGVIGGESTFDPTVTLNLSRFMSEGGVIGLDPDLVVKL